MCPFCSLAQARVGIFYTRHSFALFDRAPVTEGHTLVISRVHRESLQDLTFGEWNDLLHAIRHTISRLDSLYHPDGYNIGINCSEAAGQTVMHFHMHIIPRRKGDIENPRGGVRNLMKPLKELWPEE